MSRKSAILTYHSLDTSGSVISVAPDLFRRQIECLVERKTLIVPLQQVFETPGCVALTFDDGFENFFRHAASVLEEYSLPATVFVVSGYCGRLNNWPGQPTSGIPVLPLMTWDHLRQLPKNIEVGGHSINHPNLRKLAPADVASELRGCRAAIEDSVGRPVWSFSYPYGASSPAVRDIVRNEFTVACGTTLKFVGPKSDPMRLPRIDMHYLPSPFALGQLMAFTGSAYVALRNTLRVLRRRVEE
jgi:peptidoglycan/xylan/chitin deacetylase (PgdA/CDA1 family)